MGTLALNLDNLENSREILANPLNHRLLGAITRFANALSRFDYHVTPWTLSSIKKLPYIDVAKKQEICLRFETWASWIEPDETGKIPDKDEMEKICLRKVLDHCEFEVDDAFWKTIESGQIIEVYGKEMIQVYRSLNFFSITGYSLLDISIHEWFVLWDRPKKAVEETMMDLKEVIDTHVPVKPFRISKQIIRETLDTGSNHPFQPRAILAEFKFSGSLRARGGSDNNPVGFICTSTAKIVALGEETRTVLFI